MFLDDYSKQLGNSCDLASHIPFFHALHLPFSDDVHHLKSLQCSPSRLEGEKAHSRFRQPFDEPMILFDEVIQIFDLPQFHMLRQHSSGFELGNDFGRGRVFVDSDDTLIF
jgi:hypothetical protein